MYIKVLKSPTKSIFLSSQRMNFIHKNKTQLKLEIT